MRLLSRKSYLCSRTLRLTILINIILLRSAGVILAQTPIPAPVISSFTPATVCQGQSITITGNNFTGATAVRVGTANATAFTVLTDNTINATVSFSAQTGTVAVTTPAGTITSTNTLTINPSPEPALEDKSSEDIPFTNCDGSVSYALTVANTSIIKQAGSQYQISWGDGSTPFSQTDWPQGAEITHTYTAQGYFPITITITPPNGCTRSRVYQFYNGKNPLASLSTTSSTTGLCVPAPVEFQIGNWWGNTPGTVYELDFGDQSPHLILQHPLNAGNAVHLVTHIYNTSSCPATDFMATLRVSNGCFTTTYTLDQIVIRKKPVANFTTDAVLCINTPVCFNNLSEDGYGGTSCNRNTSYRWDFGDGTSSNQRNPPCHTFPGPGTYPVTLFAENSACGIDAITKQVIIKNVSPPPTVSGTPAVYCQGATPSQLTATGTDLLWYTSATGGTGSPTAPTPSTTIPGTYTCYVTQTLPNRCESPRAVITVIVHAIPLSPGVTSPVNLCQHAAATQLTATGTGLKWYTTASGGTGSATAPTPSTATIGTTTYYVSQTINGCESPRATIVVDVGPLAGLPQVSSPIAYCQGAPAPPLTAAGTDLLWYTSATGGSGSPFPPTPSTATPGSTTWWVSQTTGCGEGPRASITVNVTPGPSASVSYSPTVFCNATGASNPPVAVTRTGTGGGVYSISPAGMTIDPNTGTITPAGAISGTYTIRYTIAANGVCPQYVTSTTVSVSSTPAATISYPAICTSDGLTSVNISGSTGGTFAAATGLSINAATGAITPGSSIPGNYVVTYSIPASGPCPGFTTMANVSVTQAPSASIVYSPALLCNTSDPANQPVPVALTGTTGGSFSIAPTNGLNINTTTGTITPAGAQPGTYVITYTVAGAGGCTAYFTTATVTVSGTPSATISYGGSPYCSDNNVVQPVTLTGSRGGTFSAGNGLAIDQTTGAIDPAGSTPGTYTVTYTIPAAGPCPGFSTNTNVTITQAPAATIRYQPAALCNIAHSAANPNPPVTVTQTGTPGGRYMILPATGLSLNATTGTIDPSGATPGAYTISYTIAGANGCGEYVTTATVVVSGAPSATISYGNTPYCGSINTPQAVTMTGTPGGVFSAGAGLSLNATTGAIDPSLSTPGSYTVQYVIAAAPPCPGYTATANVVITESPVISFPANSQAICSGGSATFIPSSTVTNTTYNWAVSGPLPAGVSGISSGAVSGANAQITLSFTNTGTSEQSLTIRVTPYNPVPAPCAGAAYDLVLLVRPLPPAPVTDTADFCMNTPPATLEVAPLPGHTIKWYDANHGALSAAPVISTTTASMFRYYVSQTDVNGCESPQSEVVAVVHPVVKVISTNMLHPSRCGVPSGSIELNVLDLNNGAVPGIPVTVHYKKFRIAYAYVTRTDASGKITIPLTAGTYSEIYVETSGGCTSAQVPDVFILRDPTPPAQPVAGYNPPLCAGSTLTLTALSATSEAAGPVEYVWAGPAFGTLADTSRNTVMNFPEAQTDDAGTYAVYAMQNNCISLPASFEVSIQEAPSKPLISTRTPLCEGDDLVLQAYSSIPGNGGLSYLWKGPAAGFPVNTANVTINDVQVAHSGIYTVTVTSAATGCAVSTDTMIAVGGHPIVAFPEDTLALPTGYKLKLQPVITNAVNPGILPVERYTWTPTTELQCNNDSCSAPVATVKDNICYNVAVTNVYGCTGSDTICIRVFCERSQVFVPNAFTPNGGLPENRKLMVRATGIGNIRSFRVYNRWGKILFERSNFSPNDPAFGWDGRVNGKLADTGVYVYTVDVICENGVPYTFKGNVTLF